MTKKVYEDINVYGRNNLGAKEIFKQRLEYQYQYPIQYKPTILQAGNVHDQFNTPDNFMQSGLLQESPEPIDYWSLKYQKYGRIDENNNIIIPDLKHFKQIRTKEETIFVLSFVADAFEDFVKFIKTEKANGLYPDQFLTQDIEAKRGWFDINQFYDKVLNQYYMSFINTFLPNSKLDRKVVDFDSFLAIFLNVYFPEMMSEYPLTKTGILETKKISPNVTGLCVEISLDDHSNDYNKFNKYINNINFDLYTLAAAKFGFLVDKNAPWRLVANLNSPAMKEYIQKYFFTIEKDSYTGAVLNHYHDYTLSEDGTGVTGPRKQTGNLANFALVPDHTHEISNGNIVIKAVYGRDPLPPHVHSFGQAKKFIVGFGTSDIYNQFYTKTYLQDIQLLKSHLIMFYNDYANAFPYTYEPDLCLPKSPTIGDYYDNSSSRKTHLRKIRRKVMTDSDIASKYDDLFWFKTYLLVRIKERTQGKAVLDEKLNKVMSDITQLYYSVDKSSALEYINQYLKQYY
jgi:hypothetical protein